MFSALLTFSDFRARLIRTPKLCALLLVTVFASFSVQAQEMPPETRWHDSQVTILDADFPGTGFHARWEYFNCPCGDVLIRLEQEAPDGVETGELLLIENRVVAARGAAAAGEDLAPQLFAPALMMHLVSALLDRAIPEGPVVVGERREIAVSEKQQAIELDTGLATGRFPAPWQLTGSAWSSGPGRRRFELSFVFSNPQPDEPGRQDTMTFSGGQDFLRDAFPLSDESSLYGWRLQWLTGEDSIATLVTDQRELGSLRAEARKARVDAQGARQGS